MATSPAFAVDEQYRSWFEPTTMVAADGSCVAQRQEQLMGEISIERCEQGGGAGMT